MAIRQMIIKPDGWACSYADCRPGFFVVGEHLYLKTEYGDDGYCDTGEAFCVKDAIVQPVYSTWEDVDV